MFKTLQIMEWTTNLNWLAGFLNHQQQVDFKLIDFQGNKNPDADSQVSAPSLPPISCESKKKMCLSSYSPEN